MKVRELIPMLMDRVSYFVVYDNLTGDILYNGATDKCLIPDVGNAEVRFVHFRDCEGSFAHTTETICLVAVDYCWTQDDEWED